MALYDMAGNGLAMGLRWYQHTYYSRQSFRQFDRADSNGGQLLCPMASSTTRCAAATGSMAPGWSRVSTVIPDTTGPMDPQSSSYTEIGFRVARATRQQTVGLFLMKVKRGRGYTLFSPKMNRKAYLINNQGQVVHTWQAPIAGAVSVILPNGDLLYPCPIVGPWCLSTAGGEGRPGESMIGGPSALAVQLLQRELYTAPRHQALAQWQCADAGLRKGNRWLSASLLF